MAKELALLVETLQAMKTLITCPICGYDDLEVPPISGEICSCCGTEFDFTEDAPTEEEIRHVWLMHGAPWFSRFVPPPESWSVLSQLHHIGYRPTEEETEKLDADSRVKTAIAERLTSTARK